VAEAIASAHAYRGDLGSHHHKVGLGHRVSTRMMAHLEHIDIANPPRIHEPPGHVALGVTGQECRELTRRDEHHDARLVLRVIGRGSGRRKHLQRDPPAAHHVRGGDLRDGNAECFQVPGKRPGGATGHQKPRNSHPADQRPRAAIVVVVQVCDHHRL